MTELVPRDEAFDAIVLLIERARERAYQAVNTTLIDLYWQIGEQISRKIAAAEWGAGVVDRLAAHIARRHPGLRGFTRPNLFRMRQFYEAYTSAGEKVSALLRQIPWTHHLMILGQCKRPEEREFYLRLVAQEKWSSRQLERQLKLALFERAVVQPPQVSAVLRQTHPQALGAFKDAYMLEFLGLPEPHSEADLHARLLARLREFLTELGRDFCFVGSQFPLQVGGRDFALDLLFFHRELNCSKVLTYLTHRISDAVAAVLNSKIATVQKHAFAYRNPNDFKVDVYPYCGGLKLHPASATHTQAR